MIDRDARLAVVRQCRLLGMSRSSLYYRGKTVSEEELTLMRTIDEIHLARPFLGSRRITGELKDQGSTVNRKHVQRLMRVMGITAIYPKPSTSKAAKGHVIHPYLLRGLKPERANQVWVADITYLPMAKGLACIKVSLSAFRTA